MKSKTKQPSSVIEINDKGLPLDDNDLLFGDDLPFEQGESWDKGEEYNEDIDDEDWDDDDDEDWDDDDKKDWDDNPSDEKFPDEDEYTPEGPLPYSAEELENMSLEEIIRTCSPLKNIYTMEQLMLNEILDRKLTKTSVKKMIDIINKIYSSTLISVSIFAIITKNLNKKNPNISGKQLKIILKKAEKIFPGFGADITKKLDQLKEAFCW